MRASDFDFVLPSERIAQAPSPDRDQARLYVLRRDGSGAASHARIADLPSLLPDGALVVVNDSKVFPARLRGRKESGGKVELLLLEPVAGTATGTATWSERWVCLGGSSKGLKVGATVILDGDRAPDAVIAAVRGAEVEVMFRGVGEGGLLAAAERIGEVPLPPYIARPAHPSDADRARYQTVYAREVGSAAAPTAGLHFTEPLFDALAARGIGRVALTLHVGLGTFAPLRSDDVAAIDALHAERFTVPEATVRAVAAARAEGRKVIAVGTTTVRALESAAASGELRAGSGATTMFIRPGHRFAVVDGMLTNFHLPRSTLLMLVAAFAGRERILDAYRDAVARGYRFYSYGDAMLIA